MATIPNEGTGLFFGDSDPPTTEFGQVLNITSPGLMVQAVPTHHLRSTFKTKRPGRIPDAENVVLRVQYDPNDANHIAIRDLPGDPDNNNKYFKIVFVDGNSTPANVVFRGAVLSFLPDSAEDETNLEADVTIAVTEAPVFSEGY